MGTDETEGKLERDLDRYSNDAVIDVADRIRCYENGKVFECDCGQSFGVNHDLPMINCPNCHRACRDSRWREREAPSDVDGQTGLGDFR